MIEEADEVIVTEDDIDEDLIEIDLSSAHQDSVIENVIKDPEVARQNTPELPDVESPKEDKTPKKVPKTKILRKDTSKESESLSESSTTIKEKRKAKSKSGHRKEHRKSCYYCENVSILTI